MLNIGKIDIEEMIREGIKETREELENLTTERTCLIYTSHLYKNLRKRGVLAYIIDTQKEFNMEYSHYFIIIPKNRDSNYIVDLTYEQFKYDQAFDSMYNDGYQVLSSDMYKRYLSNIGNISKNNRK